MKDSLVSLWLFAVAVGLSFQAHADVLYGIRIVPTTGNVGIYSIDPATGVPALIVDTGAAGYINDDSAFDGFGRRYFFLSVSGQLYTVNVATGAFTSVSGALAEMHYDPASGKLYGIQFVPSSGKVGIYSVDPATGVPLLVVDTGVPGYITAATSFDPTGRRYFFVSAAGQLYSVNVATGTFTSVAAALAEMEYDQSDGRLYGIQFVPSSGKVGIYSVDPATGVSLLVVDTGVPGYITAATAFDPFGRRYFFVSESGQLYTVNVATGAVTSVAGALAEIQHESSPQNIPLFYHVTLVLLVVILSAIGASATGRAG